MAKHLDYAHRPIRDARRAPRAQGNQIMRRWFCVSRCATEGLCRAVHRVPTGLVFSQSCTTLHPYS
jgi:hypothetical protein